MQRKIVSLALPIVIGVMALALGWFGRGAAPLSAQGIIVDGRVTLSDPNGPDAPAGILESLTYQGRLLSSSGVPVNSMVSMTFRIYTDTNNMAIWTSATRVITPVNGLFTVYLGDGDPLLSSQVLKQAASIGVTVGTDSEMTPRQYLNSVVGHGFQDAGVIGSSSTGFGVVGSSQSQQSGAGISNAPQRVNGGGLTSAGVYGSSNSGEGVVGITNSGDGVLGSSDSSHGMSGYSNSGHGVYGNSNSGDGVFGATRSGIGVYGSSISNTGVLGASDIAVGVYGTSSANGIAGVQGQNDFGTGVYGNSIYGYGVRGSSTSSSGVYGTSTIAVGVVGSSTLGTGIFGATYVITRAGVVAYNAVAAGPALIIDRGGIKANGAGVGSNTFAFIHESTNANISFNLTRIDNVLTNGDQDAMLFVTHVNNPTSVFPNSFNKAFGVYYDSGSSEWTIYTEDNSAFPAGTTFNVMVIKR